MSTNIQRNFQICISVPLIIFALQGSMEAPANITKQKRDYNMDYYLVYKMATAEGPREHYFQDYDGSKLTIETLEQGMKYV